MPGIIAQLPYWNPDSEKVLEPADAKKNTGWISGERPPYNWMNWFFKYTYEGIKTINDNAFFNTAGINEIIEDTLANRPDAANQQELDLFIAQDTKEIYQVIGGTWARIAGSIAEQINYSGSLDSSDVKAALDELNAEKVAKSDSYSIDNIFELITWVNNNADVPNAGYADNAGQLEGHNASYFAKASEVVPVGAVFWLGSATIPDGYFKCDGTYISKTTYSELYNVIGTTFGESGDNFKLPDLRGEFIRGFDDGRGVDDGRDFGSNQSSQNLSHDHTTESGGWHDHNGSTTTEGNHNHTYYSHYDEYDRRASAQEAGNSAADTRQNTTSSDGSHSHSLNINGAGSHNHNINSAGGSESRPRNIALMPIIKY